MRKPLEHEPQPVGRFAPDLQPRLSALLAPIRPMLEEVERILVEEADSAPPPLDEMLHHAIAGGKRMRPAVILLLGSLLSGDPDHLAQVAVAVETLHVATLIHDDMVDDSPVRRGHETIHVRWSVRDGVLAGDYLLATAAKGIAALEDPQLMGVFAEILTTVCIGQIRETHTAPGEIRGLDVYRRDIEAKTASLIAGACEMAAMTSNGSEAVCMRAREFGKRLGVAFQITDDVLDFVGNEPRLGKPLGSDLRQGLLTLPALLYIDKGGADDGVLKVIGADGDRSPEAVAAAIEMIQASGAIDAALAEAQEQAQAALAILTELDTPERTGSVALRDALRGLVTYTVSRGR